MRRILADFRFGVRLLSSHRGFTAVAVITLAVGIATTTAVFSVLDTMYWKAFPGAAEPGRLVELETVAPDGSMVQGSWLQFREYREGLNAVAAVAAHVDALFTIGAGEHARPVRGELVSSNYFDVLGVKPLVGRTFADRERKETPGADAVVVISHRFWIEEFQGSRDAVGKTLWVNRRNLTVVGVAPPRFRGAMEGMRCAVFVPFAMSAELGAKEKDTFSDSSLRNLYMFARLRPGVRIEEAKAQTAAIASRLSAEAPAKLRGFGATMEPMWRSTLHGRAAFLQPMVILMAVSFLVMTIVCANVANLLLARSITRAGEFGIRSALGASRGRLAWQCLTETLLLAVAGGTVGIPLSLWMTDGAMLLIPKAARAGAIPIEMDWRILAFAGAMCVAAAFASSTAAILLVSRTGIEATLREAGRSRGSGMRGYRLRSGLVVAEVAVATIVLVGAGLFLRTYRNLNAIDPGFDRNGVLLADFPISSGGYTVEELQRFCVRVREQLHGAAGIAGSAYADYAPLWATDGPYHTTEPEGYTTPKPEDLKVHRTAISPGYFELLKMPLRAGRDFTDRDDAAAQRVMIVNEAFARKYYGGGTAVGRRVRVRGLWWTVVGVARDGKHFSFTEPPQPHFYVPFRQWYLQGQNIIFFVRAKGEPESAIGGLRAAVAGIDPNAAGFTAVAMAERNSMLLIPIKLATAMLSALASIALLLAGVGLYGVISYAVSQRTRELGIRMALGAQPRELLTSVAREGMKLTAMGVACGSVVSALSMQGLKTLLVDVSPWDPPTFAGATGFLLLIASAASFVPARRASRVAPMEALRAE